jgi:hypothetical protein
MLYVGWLQVGYIRGRAANCSIAASHIARSSFQVCCFGRKSIFLFRLAHTQTSVVDSSFNDNAFSSLTKSSALVTNLQRLVLRGCRQLTARGLTRVSRLAALQHLDLCATQVLVSMLFYMFFGYVMRICMYVQLDTLPTTRPVPTRCWRLPSCVAWNAWTCRIAPMSLAMPSTSSLNAPARCARWCYIIVFS